MPIHNVSDTARWVAVYRAMETARPDAIFRDPFAERLAGERGHEIVRELKHGRQMAWAMIVRTAVLDEMILDRVRHAGVDTVINLAAGLDTRAWRFDLPRSLRWFDLDLPEMVAYKAAALRNEPPACQYEALAVDLTSDTERAQVLRRVGGVSQTALVITEGLLVYLGDEKVASLARALHDVPSIKWWVSDIGSPRLLEILNKQWGTAVAAGNAPFLFAPADSLSFFARLGWREIEFRSGLAEAHRLKREMPMMWLWRFLGRLGSPRRREEFRRMSGYIMLERV